MNHREGERHPTDLAVTVQGVNREPIQARLRDVSLSGAGIEYPDRGDIHPMETVDLAISLPRDIGLDPVRISGFVVRRSPGWLGVMFMREAPWLPRALREVSSRPGQRSGWTPRPPVLSGLLFSDY